MDMRIFENSYIVSIMMFIVLYILFYFAGIGFVKTQVNGKIIEKYSWKYPLAGALVTWLIWHFYLYPVTESVTNIEAAPSVSNPVQSTVPKINMVTWH